MTIAAMKQALEALKISNPVSNSNSHLDAHSEAIAALRAAIEQAEKAEPQFRYKFRDRAALDAWIAANAMLPHPAVPAWQPIETAPKDGNGEKFIGCVWNGQQDRWYGKEIAPTHWMPLPAAPKPGEMK